MKSLKVVHHPGNDGNKFSDVQTEIENLRKVNFIQQFGGVGDGSTDNTAAWTAAVAALPNTGGVIRFPAGKYRFNSAVSYSLAATANAAITLEGDGADVSILYFPSTNGITINAQLATQGMHFRDLTWSTGAAGGHSALILNNSVLLGNFGQSDVYRCTFRGDDGGAATDYWDFGIAATGLSNINFDGSLFYGDSTGTHGVGISLAGNASVSPNYGIVYNASKCGFFNIEIGLLYGSYIQGVTVSQCNFTNGTAGIQSNSSETGALAQLAVLGCQFNVTGSAIASLTAIDSFMAIGNLFYVAPTGTGINLSREWLFTICGNHFVGTGSPNNNEGIASTTSNASHDAGTISGNIFNNLTFGVVLGASSSNVVVSADNAYGGVTVPVTDNGGADNNSVSYPLVGAALTDASPITWNLQTQQSAHVLLTSGVGATRQLQNPANMVDGATYVLRVKQSSTGSNALTYDSDYKWPGGVAPTLSTANNAIDILTFTSDGSAMYGVIQHAFA